MIKYQLQSEGIKDQNLLTVHPVKTCGNLNVTLCMCIAVYIFKNSRVLQHCTGNYQNKF